MRPFFLTSLRCSFWRHSLVAAVAFVLPTVLPAAPLSLEQAVHLALVRNPSIKVESYSREIARANVLSAYGLFDPALNFRRTYGHNEDPSAAAVSGAPPLLSRSVVDDYSLTLDGVMPWGLSYSIGGNARNRRGTFNSFADNYVSFGGVSVSQPLLRGFGFGNTLAGVRIAKADRAISDWDYRDTVIDTITRVIFAYNDLAQARLNVRIAQRSRDLAMSLLAANEKRFQVGARSESDVTETRARAARREEAILTAERFAQDSENFLRQLIGDNVFAGERLEIESLPQAPNVTVAPAEDVQVALDHRPDYQAARLNVERFRLNQTRARNQLLPRLDLVGSYGYSGADRDFALSRRQIRDQDNASWSAGIVVSVPLAFAEGRGRAQAARLLHRQAEEILRRLEQEISVEIANAAGQIETTQQRIVATRHAFDLGAQALAAEEKKLLAGTRDTFFVLELQESLADLESRVVRAQTDHRKALANYDRVLGRTIQRLNLTIE